MIRDSHTKQLQQMSGKWLHKTITNTENDLTLSQNILHMLVFHKGKFFALWNRGKHLRIGTAQCQTKVVCAVTLAGPVREINSTTDWNKKHRLNAFLCRLVHAILVQLILVLHSQKMPLYGSVWAKRHKGTDMVEKL